MNITETIKTLRTVIAKANEPQYDPEFHARADAIETRLNVVESMYQLDQSEGLETIQQVNTDILLIMHGLMGDLAALGREIQARHG
jgi:hypothetical protein